MTKFRIYLFLLLAVLCLPAKAQNRLEFIGFEEDVTDLSARSQPRFDLNGEPAALLKIQIASHAMPLFQAL